MTLQWSIHLSEVLFVCGWILDERECVYSASDFIACQQMGTDVLSALTCPGTLLDGDGDRIGALFVCVCKPVCSSSGTSPLCYAAEQARKHLQGRTAGLSSYSV